MVFCGMRESVYVFVGRICLQEIAGSNDEVFVGPDFVNQAGGSLVDFLRTGREQEVDLVDVA